MSQKYFATGCLIWCIPVNYTVTAFLIALEYVDTSINFGSPFANSVNSEAPLGQQGNLQGNACFPVSTLDSLRYTNPENMKTGRALTGPFRRVPNSLKINDFPFCIGTYRDKSLNEKAAACWIMLLKWRGAVPDSLKGHGTNREHQFVTAAIEKYRRMSEILQFGLIKWVTQ